MRTRIHHRDWDPVPLSPVEAVPRIAPRPLLVVHGDRDGYFPLDHPRMLAEAGVAASSGVDFDRARGHRTVRFSYCGPEADMAEGAERLRRWLGSPAP